jgi:tRNA A37 threonylcarbamoyladenosine dehydratase
LQQFSRTRFIIGQAGLDRLRASKVAVFGVGGVGSFAVEALARAGIGSLLLVDHDVVCQTNINRQLHATIHTIGQPKVKLMKERVLAINPCAQVEAVQEFYLPDTAERLFPKDADYIIDAIDNVAGKLSLARRAWENRTPIISAMGAGNKLDPLKFKVADIFSTSADPLARVMRKKLRAAGVPALKVVYSEELPCTPQWLPGDEQTPGSISFVPSAAGLILAAEAVRGLLEEKR